MKQKRRLAGIPVGTLALALALSGWGCSSSSSDPKVSGQGPEGVKSALVCLDMNDNFACDPGEPSTRTDAAGNYSLRGSSAQVDDHRVLWVANDAAVDGETGASLPYRFTLASLPGEPHVISIFTTLLTVEGAPDEAALKEALGIEEEGSLLGGYAPEGEIATHGEHLQNFYAGLYQAASADSETTPAQRLKKVVDVMLDHPERLAAYVDRVTSPPDAGDPPLGDPVPTSTRVGEEIFQNIPINAGTMSFGVGMDEITREVVSGSYCLDIPQAAAVPELAISENSRNYTFRLIRSEKDLRELLNVGGGLDLGTQVVQGSLEGRFINEYRSSSDAIFALVKAEYILSGYKLFGVSLASHYLQADPTLASYVSNYEAFRRACGDRYLDQISTGGAYYGMLKITASDDTSKQDLQVKLDGKYGKAGISVKVKGDLQSQLQEALSNTNITITVGSRGVSPQYLGLTDPKDQLIDNLDKFLDAAEAFMAALSDGNNECHDDAQAPKKCAYMASFADYATISGGIPRNLTQVKNLNFTTKLMGQYEDYRILSGMLDDIMIHKLNYDLEGRSDLDEGAIWYLKGDLDKGFRIMDAAFRKCMTDFEGCTNNPQVAKLKTFNEIVMDLPMRKWEYPRHCQDLQRLFGPTDRSAATVYLSGDRNKPFKVSCTEMDTSEPKTYLDLVNTSTTTAPSYNMAQYVNPDGSTVTSVYKKLRVNVNYEDLEIINDQDAYVETVSTAAEDSPTAAENFSRARLGTAVDCYATTGEAMSNIDLTETSFQFDVRPADAPEGVLDHRLRYVTDAHPATRYEWVPDYMTWDEADAHARSKGGHLAVIDSQEEWNTLIDMMRKNYTLDTWIGLKRTDLAQPQFQQFQWITTGKNLTSAEKFAYFYTGEPNNGGSGQGCVAFWSVTNFLLDDKSCSTPLPSLIEYELSIPEGVAEFLSADTVVNLRVDGEQQGVCSEIRPSTNVIRLKYKPKK